jgi:hypothetical protein
MERLVSQTPATLHTVPLGEWQVRVQGRQGLAFIIDGVNDAPADYVNEALLVGSTRDTFMKLIETEGLVICRNVGGSDHLHRDVRGRSSKGRLSQGEYYHHDGCSGPSKPRVVEIRCPHQANLRHIATAVARFADVVNAMLLALPPELQADATIAVHCERALAGLAVPVEQRDTVQGLVNRLLRRRLKAEATRAYFRQVDELVGAYREPWQMGESRFILNGLRALDGSPDSKADTMQHRRAYQQVVREHDVNGRLMKRWPDGPEHEDVCELPAAAL